MSDAVSLRNLLRRLDMSAPGIQGSAGAMMKHYDKSAKVAVVEWRNALHQARQDQHLPLLYVANEVLQNSKRNRGNKFLEAFSPVLGQSLIFICQKNPSVVEKVRRTVKIWGDRHVFSVRYVNELLKGLDFYRDGTSGQPESQASSPAPVSIDNVGAFSPMDKPAQSPEEAKHASNIDIDKELAMDDEDDDNESEDDEELESEAGDLFADSGARILDISVDLDLAAASAASGSPPKATGGRKRRRPGATSETSGSKASRRRSVLSTNSLMELWNQVSELQGSYDNAQTLLAVITPDLLDVSKISEQTDTLVGNELLQEYKRNISLEKRVVSQRKELHSIANKRKVLEKDAVRYLPWLEAQLKQDRDDIDFCHTLRKQLESFRLLHKIAKTARDVRLEEEARLRKKEEELQKKKQEDEERKKFMESAMSKVTEAEPGMVWNKATGEYQYLKTDESWRD